MKSNIISPSNDPKILFYVDGRPVHATKTTLFMYRYGRGIEWNPK